MINVIARAKSFLHGYTLIYPIVIIVIILFINVVIVKSIIGNTYVRTHYSSSGLQRIPL